MRLFGVKIQQHDWFRMGHSDWLLGWGRFGPFVSCDPIVARFWSHDLDNGDCHVLKIESLVCGWFYFQRCKMANNIKDFALLNKNMVVVFNLTMFGGIRDALCIGNVCPDFIVAVYSNISGGPRVGPNLIAHVSSIYKWCVQWLAWGSRCCCFRGVDCLKDLDF